MHPQFLEKIATLRRLAVIFPLLLVLAGVPGFTRLPVLGNFKLLVVTVIRALKLVPVRLPRIPAPGANNTLRSVRLTASTATLLLLLTRPPVPRSLQPRCHLPELVVVDAGLSGIKISAYGCSSVRTVRVAVAPVSLSIQVLVVAKLPKSLVARQAPRRQLPALPRRQLPRRQLPAPPHQLLQLP